MNRHTLYRLTTIALAVGLYGLVIAVLGWSVAGGTSAAPEQQSNNGTTTTIVAHAPVGQQVLVAVNTNPSTGYHWQVQPVAGMKVSSADFPTRKADPRHPLVGVPVIRVYQLTVVKASITPYIVLLTELTPTGQPSGKSVVVTISTQS